MKTKSEKSIDEPIEKANQGNVQAEMKIPIKVAPFDHQIKGYDMVCKIFGFKEVV